MCGQLLIGGNKQHSVLLYKNYAACKQRDVTGYNRKTFFLNSLLRIERRFVKLQNVFFSFCPSNRSSTHNKQQFCAWKLGLWLYLQNVFADITKMPRPRFWPLCISETGWIVCQVVLTETQTVEMLTFTCSVLISQVSWDSGHTCHSSGDWLMKVWRQALSLILVYVEKSR